MNNLPETLRIPLERALSVMRPSGSKEEAQLRAWICSNYPNLDMIDEVGNLYFKIGESETCFAAHCDTVHHMGGKNTYSVVDNVVWAGEDCLGADDGAGIAILCHMMSHKIPGIYIFTTGEEVGGTGAQYIADNFPDVLANCKRAICFDRAGLSEIITVQGGDRCASSGFADALSVELAQQDLLYAESDRGVFTDNALWSHLVPEGVNLGVGYFQQHGKKEHLDLKHFAQLAEAVLNIDWENLPTERDCGASDTDMTELQNACFDAATGFLRNICQYMAVEAGAFKTIIPADWYDLSQLDDWEIEQILEEYIEDYLNIH